MIDDIFPTGRAWIELNRDALRHNVRVLSALLPPGCDLMPVVKANAYGHGMTLVAKELWAQGLHAFCVATAMEGVELREAGIAGEILVLGYTHPGYFPLLQRYRLTQTVPEPAYAEALSQAGFPIRVQLKLDTGMHRLGMDVRETDRIAALFDLPNLEIMGAFTHLCADTSTSPHDKAITAAQAAAFRSTLDALAAKGCAVPKAHLLASYGLLNYPELGGDYARTGIALYGLLSEKGDACPVELCPVLSLKARIAQIHVLAAGDKAGYDHAFCAQQETCLATLTIGYADGLPRSLSEGVGEVLIHGHKAPIAGRICMDQTLVDVTNIPQAAPGDEAILIGTSGSLTITAGDMAEKTSTLTNEILSRLGPRLNRIWV